MKKFKCPECGIIGHLVEVGHDCRVETEVRFNEGYAELRPDSEDVNSYDGYTYECSNCGFELRDENGFLVDCIDDVYPELERQGLLVEED